MPHVIRGLTLSVCSRRFSRRILKVSRLSRLHPRVHHVHRSEEHTSELQSRLHLVCRLLLEKKKILITKLGKRTLVAFTKTDTVSRSSLTLMEVSLPTSLTLVLIQYLVRRSSRTVVILRHL